MPKVLEKCVKKLSKKEGKDSAYGICTKTLQKAGVLKKGTNKLVKKK